MYRRGMKRILDFLLAAVLLVLLSPVLVIVAFLVRILHGSPVLFHQDRPGLNEKIFRMYKFRSMTEKRDAEGNLLPDSDRVTPFGLFLRKTSLDELPELFNVLRGEMSFVGPRPLLEEYLPWYTERERLRHSVLPGITGLAQVNGRNLLDWDSRLDMDACYAEQCSFALDVKIFLKTFAVVLGHTEEVAKDTSAAEGNLREIRMKAKEEKTGEA